MFMDFVVVGVLSRDSCCIVYTERIHSFKSPHRDTGETSRHYYFLPSSDISICLLVIFYSNHGKRTSCR